MNHKQLLALFLCFVILLSPVIVSIEKDKVVNVKKVNENYILVDNMVKKLQDNVSNNIKVEKEKAIKLISKIDALSPLKTLTRGYCITSKNDEIMKSINEIEVDDEINIRFIDGSVRARIIEKES